MPILDHNHIILLTLSYALSAFCQDAKGDSLRMTDARRALLVKAILEVCKHQFVSQSFIQAEIVFSACCAFFYARTVELWCTKAPPDLAILIEEMALIADPNDQTNHVTTYATRLMLSGGLEQLYPLPLGLREGDDRIMLALLIALDAVCDDYPTRGDANAIVERIRTILYQLRMQKNTPDMLLSSEAVFASIVERSVLFYQTLANVFQEHHHVATLLVEQQVAERVQWLACHLHELDGGSARSLQQVPPFEDPIELETVLLRTKSACCLMAGCTKRSRPTMFLEIVMAPKTLYATVMACSEHRMHVLQAITASRVLDVAHQVATQKGCPLSDLPRIRFLPHVPLRDKVQTFSALIERFRIKNRPSSITQAAQPIAGEQGVRFVEAFLDALVDLSSKAFLDTSAMAMALCLPWLDAEQAIEKAVMYGPTVIGLQDPIPSIHGPIRGLSLSQYRQAIFDYAQQRSPLLSKRILEQLRTILLPVRIHNAWGLDIFDEEGDTIYSLSFWHEQNEGSTQLCWMVNDRVRTCIHPDCGEGQLCASCMVEASGYLGLYANMVRLLTREVSDTEEARPFREQVERVIRKEPDPKKPHKKREIFHDTTYRLVTFNAAVPRKAPSISTETPKQPRGSWLAQLDPETIWWEEKPIGKGVHRLRHVRYHTYIVNQGGNPDDPNGYPLAVKAHPRRIPRTFKHLRRVKHVIFEVPGEE